YQIQGGFSLYGLPLATEVAAGRVGEGGAMPVRASLRLPEGTAGLRFAGIVTLGEALRLQGDLRAEGTDLRAPVRAVLTGDGGGNPGTVEGPGPEALLPPLLNQPFSLRTTLDASSQLLNVNNLEVQLGDTRGTGTIKVVPGNAVPGRAAQGRTSPGTVPGAPAAADRGPTSATVTLAFNRFDLDAWLARPAGAQNGAGGAAFALPGLMAGRGGFRLPSALQAVFDISIDAMSYRGNLMRQTRLEAALEGGRLAVTRFGGLAPGGSEITLNGTLAAEGGAPLVDGGFTASADDLRAVLDWLGMPTDRVPADRLHKFSATGQVRGTPPNLQLAGLDLVLDTTRVTGGVAYVDRGRPGFGVRLDLDRLNLDAYDPELARGLAGRGPRPIDLAALTNAADANLDLHVGTLTLGGVAIHDLALDGTLSNGAVALRSARAADVAGLKLALSGSLGKVQPFDNLNLTLSASAPSLAPLVRTLRIRSPVPPEQIGDVTLQGRFAGDLERLAVEVKLGAAGGTVEAAGTVAQIPTVPNVDLKARATFGE
ncbi:MAG: hypothetical protein ACJ786_22585, partial [Catenulispora sp.]